MFLHRLELTNIRSIGHLDLSFAAGDPKQQRKWTFLLGVNGVGKSSVLRAIALVLAGSDAIVELVRTPGDWIRFGTAEASICAELRTARGEARSITLCFERTQSTLEFFKRNHDALEALDNALAHSTRNYLVLGYGVSRRVAMGFPDSMRGDRIGHPRAQAVATLFFPDAQLNPLESWAMDLDYRKGVEGLETVRQAISKIIPGVTFVGIAKDQRELLFETAEGTVPLRLLSDGYQHMTAWFGDLLYRITTIFDDYKDPLSARGLLLIDELELHLHPLWQRRLIETLDELLPNMQIVATTHSPVTAHQAGENELYVLRRPATQAAPTLVPYEGAPRNLLLHQLLASPIFGLDSLHSHVIESLRQEYRELTQIPTRTPAQQRRLDKIVVELGTEPPAEQLNEQTDEENRLATLLENVQTQLAGGGHK